MTTDKCKQAYETLGLNEDAVGKEVTRSFRKLSRKLHPDHNKQDGAGEKYAQVLDAYGTLKQDCGRNALPSVEEMLKNTKPVFKFGGHREFDESRIKHEQVEKVEKAYSWSDSLYDFYNGVILGNSIEGNDEA